MRNIRHIACIQMFCTSKKKSKPAKTAAAIAAAVFLSQPTNKEGNIWYFADFTKQTDKRTY